MKKKCVIITLHTANNIGAFLQAYGLMTIIKRLGFDVGFASYPSDISEKSNMLGKIIRYIKTGDIRKLLYKIRTSALYREIQSLLPVVNMNENPEFDCAVVGSDEVWNIKSPNFVHYSSFLGHNINANKIIAYAPCGNGITENDFKEILPEEDFSTFTSLSARDEDTIRCVSSISGREVMRVVDPTMLVDNFDVDLPACPIKKDFIMVYSYGIESKYISAIKRFAKEKKIPLISVGTYNAWCDENLIVTPWQFLAYLKAAKYVVVSTFHGTVLSIKFNKQFVCVSGNTSKVKDILNYYNLNSRIVLESTDISKLFESEVDYKTVNEFIIQTRSVSLDYLTKALGK